MKIAIIGTRGIPNNHGGFEQFAENFSVHLSDRDHEVYVYNSHLHPYQENKFKGVNIIHCYDPEYKIGTAGQFIYDFNCILDSRKRDYDVILQLGYTSSSIWYKLLPEKSIIVTNMDGLEWKRTKYNKWVRRFLEFAEKLGAKHSDYLISDSLGIKHYLKEKYNKDSKFIAYGAETFENPRLEVLRKYEVDKYRYCLIIARLEPENNIEVILDGYVKSSLSDPILVFGKINNFGKMLKNKYHKENRVKFVGADYSIDNLNNLRFYSRYYFHGHSVGGTNPSLLEAMASNALIISHNNDFNKSVLGQNAKYFDSHDDIVSILDKDDYFQFKTKWGDLNNQEIKNNYSCNFINTQYENYFYEISAMSKKNN